MILFTDWSPQCIEIAEDILIHQWWKVFDEFVNVEIGYVTILFFGVLITVPRVVVSNAKNMELIIKKEDFPGIQDKKICVIFFL